MNHVFRYRIYPTKKQTVTLEQMLQNHCDIYNAALQERREAYQHSGVTIQHKEPLTSQGINVAAKSGLNKSVLDARWSTLTQMIRYKAESASTFF